MLFKWIRAVVALPFNALVVIPAIIVWIWDRDIAFMGAGWVVAGGLLMALGLALAVWTMVLFHHKGKGTPAPWDPPKKLVVAGPYRHTRNPMLTSVFIMLFAEALATHSTALVTWFFLFVIINLLYFMFFEEKELLKRFGEDYAKYKANVPRCIPRIKPWKDN